MTGRVDLFDSTYRSFGEQVLRAIRQETFGVDIGQNSWLTVDEYDQFLSWLGVDASRHVLEVACGSGGPARYLAESTGCRVTGIDVNANGVSTAAEMAVRSAVPDRLQFSVADANAPLPFADRAFDACYASIR